jgi:DNA-binding XRE family transcriptional regulator
MPQVPVVRPDGPEIQRRRLELGLSVEDVGRSIRRHGQTIRRIERDTVKPVSQLLIHQVARVLKCKASDITLGPVDSETAA